ncbi:hypothetical protein OSB04_006448 [Centaurea solstitialis]|uniref:Uncharacterized protein n=1 Tax=Centaurea solstitialis TaxID=347529 RepID=A0AA38TQI9_9ASTR|nr:hypothetical protein OSB04_006448 [Centaurea solstitialis]
MAQAKEPREHHKSRNVLRKYHLIREIIGRGDVRICKIPIEDNVADPLTKPLARVKHEAHANSIGMQYLDTGLCLHKIGRVLGYLKKTSDLELTYKTHPRILKGYTNVSWIDNLGDSKSTNGWIYTQIHK